MEVKEGEAGACYGTCTEVDCDYPHADAENKTQGYCHQGGCIPRAQAAASGSAGDPCDFVTSLCASGLTCTYAGGGGASCLAE
jgi:hypothetical protein